MKENSRQTQRLKIPSSRKATDFSLNVVEAEKSSALREKAAAGFAGFYEVDKPTDWTAHEPVAEPENTP
jgi:hypothetical protein